MAQYVQIGKILSITIGSILQLKWMKLRLRITFSSNKAKKIPLSYYALILNINHSVE